MSNAKQWSRPASQEVMSGGVKQPMEVAAGLVFRSGRLLITQRYADAHLGGLWEFPGGKREPGETFKQCLTRELQEELGIEVTIREQVDCITHQYPGKVVQLHFFRCVWSGGEPRPLGCEALRWVSVEELNDYSFPAADEQLLERLRKDASLWET